MSKVADFYAKVIADEALRSKATEIIGGKNPDELGDDELGKLVKFAGEEGYAVTVAEVKEYLASGVRDLSDEAMDAVAGGKQKGAFNCSGSAQGHVSTTDNNIGQK